MQVSVGSTLVGKVIKIMNYGAFVDLESGGSGMIHISEISPNYVKDINDFLKIGDQVTVKVVGISPENKISLSIKALQKTECETQQKKQSRTHSDSAPLRGGRFVSLDDVQSGSVKNSSFEEMLNRYKKDSDDRISDLKRITDAKRGSGNRRSKKK